MGGTYVSREEEGRHGVSKGPGRRHGVSKGPEIANGFLGGGNGLNRGC